MRGIARVVLAAMGIAALPACAVQPARVGAAAGTEAAPAVTSLQAVLQLIGDAACTVDTDCRTLAIGVKACGGPQRYLAWSAVRTDEQALTTAAAAAEQQQAAQRAKPGGMASTCSFEADPGAVCVAAPGGARQCVLATGGRGAGAR